MAEHLSCICKDLWSIPSTETKQKTKLKKRKEKYKEDRKKEVRKERGKREEESSSN